MKQITEQQIESYLKYFNVGQDWLFNQDKPSEKKQKWIQSVFVRFTDFGYHKDKGLVLREELPEGTITYANFEDTVDTTQIKDVPSLREAINEVLEDQKINRLKRSKKISEVLSQLEPEEKKKQLLIIKEGQSEIAKIQFITQGKSDLHISDFSKERLEKLSQYQQTITHINQSIQRQQELQQNKSSGEQCR